MRSDDIVDSLSLNPRCKLHTRPTERLVLASVVSLVIVGSLSIGLLGDSANQLTEGSVHNHGFILNFIFIVSVAACALAIVRDLSVPARLTSLSNSVLAAPFVLMLVVVLHELAGSSLHELSRGARQVSWLSCFWQITVLATPAFVVLTYGVRSLAPTNLRRTGAYIGMLAGALGGMGHCLHVATEPAVFGAILYTGVIVSMMLIGALIGPRVLRWT